MQALLTERTPTGKTVNGNDINFITPTSNSGRTSPRSGCCAGYGINIDTGRKSATDVYFNNLAIGRYLTTKDARIFKELVAHVVVSTLSDVLGRKNHITDIYIAPGIRFGLDRDQKWYVLGAIQVPVSGPQPYDWLSNFALFATIDRARGPVASAASGRRRTGRAGRRTTTSLRPVASSGRFVSLVPGRLAGHAHHTTLLLSLDHLADQQTGDRASPAAPRGRAHVGQQAQHGSDHVIAPRVHRRSPGPGLATQSGVMHYGLAFLKRSPPSPRLSG